MKRAAFALALLMATATTARAQVGLDLGTVGPGARVETLDGKPADLSQYIGRTPALMEFWATWCENCQQLEPTIKAMHAKYGTRVNFVGVAVSVSQSPERVKAYVAHHDITWPQVFDRHGDASGAYDAPATSYVVVLDRTGKVVYTGVGGTQDLESAIQKALAR
jgi:thiol-disulfide isomerase/thioredoxin